MDYKEKYQQLKNQALSACKTEQEKARIDNEVAYFAKNGIEEYVALAADLVNSLEAKADYLFAGGSVYDSLFIFKCRRSKSGEADKQHKVASFEEFAKTPLNLHVNAVGIDKSFIADRVKDAERCLEPILKASGFQCKEIILTNLPSSACMGERVVISNTPLSSAEVNDLANYEAGSGEAARKYLLLDVLCFQAL
jgi:hypothetical protein